MEIKVAVCPILAVERVGGAVHVPIAVTRLLPGGPQPTLLAVAGQPDQLVLQALCAGEISWRQLEEIKKAGAREMYVLPVEKMLA